MAKKLTPKPEPVAETSSVRAGIHRRIAELYRELAKLHEELALEEIPPAPERKPARRAIQRVLPERELTEVERAHARRVLRKRGALPP